MIICNWLKTVIVNPVRYNFGQVIAIIIISTALLANATNAPSSSPFNSLKSTRHLKYIKLSISCRQIQHTSKLVSGCQLCKLVHEFSRSACTCSSSSSAIIAIFINSYRDAIMQLALCECNESSQPNL